MTTDTPAVVASEAMPTADAQVANSQWFDTTLTVLFTAVVVLFVSFIAVVTGLV